MAAPILAKAKNNTTHSGRFVDQSATRSPLPMPRHTNPLAQFCASSSNCRKDQRSPSSGKIRASFSGYCAACRERTSPSRLDEMGCGAGAISCLHAYGSYFLMLRQEKTRPVFGLFVLTFSQGQSISRLVEGRRRCFQLLQDRPD